MNIIRKIARRTGLLLAPFMMLAYRITGSNFFLTQCLKFDRTYNPALKQRAVNAGHTGVHLDQFTQAHIMLSYMGDSAEPILKKHLPHAQSQLLQDVGVVCVLGELEKGYFVEVGVGNGVNISNTVMLERALAWTGLLVEPNIGFHPSIKKNRKAKLCAYAAHETDGLTLQFEAMKQGEFSRLVEVEGSIKDLNVDSRYEVTTSRLDTLLSKNKAPKIIDYISIDTEGNEVSVLHGLDLAKWTVKLFSVEHNYEAAKTEQIDAYFSKYGYKKILAPVFDYDYFYIHPDYIPEHLAD